MYDLSPSLYIYMIYIYIYILDYIYIYIYTYIEIHIIDSIAPWRVPWLSHACQAPFRNPQGSAFADF